MREYDLIADWYQRESGTRSIGVPEVLEAVSSLPSGARILDLGCGNGVPITRALLDAGYRVVGMDTSRAMLERFRVNLPRTPAIPGDCRMCPFADRTFDGAVSWGMMFHLTPRDQVRTLASVSRILRPGAPFLFTGAEVPDVDNDTNPGITGTMNGVTFHYWAVNSFGPLLAEQGFELEKVYDDPGVSTYYFARKAVAPTLRRHGAGSRRENPESV